MHFGLKIYSLHLVDDDCYFQILYFCSILLKSQSYIFYVFQKELDHVKYVLGTLKTNFFIATGLKCKSFQSNINYLGFAQYVSKILLSKQQISAFKNFGLPKTAKKLILF